MEIEKYLAENSIIEKLEENGYICMNEEFPEYKKTEMIDLSPVPCNEGMERKEIRYYFSFDTNLTWEIAISDIETFSNIVWENSIDNIGISIDFYIKNIGKIYQKLIYIQWILFEIFKQNIKDPTMLKYVILEGIYSRKEVINNEHIVNILPEYFNGIDNFKDHHIMESLFNCTNFSLYQDSTNGPYIGFAVYNSTYTISYVSKHKLLLADFVDFSFTETKEFILKNTEELNIGA